VAISKITANSVNLTSIGRDDDANTSIDFDGSDVIAINTGGSEALRIDASQRVLMGHTSSLGNNRQLQVVNATNNAVGSLISTVDGNGGAQLEFVKGRGGVATNTATIVQNDDALGFIRFFGADGTDLLSEAGRIRCGVDGTPGVDDMPGDLNFLTTADGASSPTERMRIDNKGYVGLNIAPVAAFQVQNPASEQTASTIDIPYSWDSTSTGTFQIAIRHNTGTTQRGLLFVELEIGGANDSSYQTYQVLKCRVVSSNNASDAGVTAIREEDKFNLNSTNLSVSAAHGSPDTTTITVSGWSSSVDHRTLRIKATARNFLTDIGFTQN
jgi:hypothetical protein